MNGICRSYFHRCFDDILYFRIAWNAPMTLDEKLESWRKESERRLVFLNQSRRLSHTLEKQDLSRLLALIGALQKCRFQRNQYLPDHANHWEYLKDGFDAEIAERMG